MTRSLLATLIACTFTTVPIASAGVEDLDIQARIGNDGLTVEFVVSNPDPATYRCSSIHVDTTYSTGTGTSPIGPFFSTVEDAVIVAQQTGQVFKQAADDVSALRTQFPLIESVASLAQVTQFCSVDSARFEGALILDDHARCGDDRTFAKIYSVDTQTGQFATMAPPVVWQHETARIWASPSLPVVYTLDNAGAQPVLHALALTPGELAARGQLSLPEAPSVSDSNGGTHSVELAGAAFAGAWLALVYSPHPSQDPNASNITIDLITLDPETGAPSATERLTLNANPFAGTASDLFEATTITGNRSLFLVPVPVHSKYVIGGVGMFSETPVDTFEDLHGRIGRTGGIALQIDVIQSNGPPEFRIPPNEGSMPLTDWSAVFRNMVALNALPLPEPAPQARIANFGLTLAPGTGLRELQLLALQDDGGLPVLSDSDAGFCKAQLLAVTPQSGGAVETDVNATDSAGRSLLHYAATQGDMSKVADLIARGADVSLTDNEGYTPVLRAVAGNHGAVLNLLLSKGAPVTDKAPSPFGGSTSFAFYLVSHACDTCLAPLKEASVSLDPVQTPQGTFSLEQTVCGQFAFARSLLDRRFPPDSMLQHVPEEHRDRMKAEREAYLARDTREDRLERMIGTLALSCQTP